MKLRYLIAAVLSALALFALPSVGHAAAGAGFDVDSATRAYLDTLQGPAREKSDAYFEGGYWLILWGALVTVLVDGLLLKFGFSSRFRMIGERLSKRRWIVTWATGVLYLIAGFVLTLPWSIYTRFVREKSYGLVSQSFGEWATDQGISLILLLLIGPLVIVAIYAVIRRAPRTWWLWGTGVAGAFLALGMMIAPLYIAPLFNQYSEMPASPLRDKVVAMAKAHDVPSEHIYVVDASKQSKRISANVSGIGPTIRISLNDNLLNRTSEPEVAAVMGHELGHYVRGHIWVLFFSFLAVVALGLFIAARIAPGLIGRHGAKWGVRDLADPASMPLLSIIITLYFLAMTPVTNSIVRLNESDADTFGLEAAKEPDGFARVAMRLSEYRKIEPSAVEEFLFFDHPSGATRVRMAMEWKAQNVDNPQIVTPPPLIE